MRLTMGARILNRKKQEIEFLVFAFNRQKVDLFIQKEEGETLTFAMVEVKPHVYRTTVTGLGLQLLYKFRLDGGDAYPDPYSQFQPTGVHGFSQVIDHDKYNWQDNDWPGIELENTVIMEIHTGTFTAEGTFQGIISRLDYLSVTGINAIELMPVTQTPGRYNWGYDGVGLFSVNHNYGTPDDLKRLVDNCHQRNIAVILDVVYNHFGPEGNYLPFFGPYLTGKHRTPWGQAVNFDDEYCEFTRNMVLENVLYWLECFHFDGLRLDAVHAIKDSSTPYILKEISLTVKEVSLALNRKLCLIAESDQNETRLINNHKTGGYGIDAQWMDDFHHCVHTALTHENEGYYQDYNGSLTNLKKVYRNYLYTGQYSRYLKKHRGTDASQTPGSQFIVSLQNHDQVGNRAYGDRLSTLVEFPYLKLAAALLFFSPYIPLLFMGEEYGEQRPFLFFTDYGSANLKKAVHEGRKKEFASFGWTDVPDPQNPSCFFRSKLSSPEEWKSQNRWLYNFYRELISLRLNHPVLKKPDKKNLRITYDEDRRIFRITRWNNTLTCTGLFNLSQTAAAVACDFCPGRVILNSEDEKFGGKGNCTLPPPFLAKGQLLIIESEP